MADTHRILLLYLSLVNLAAFLVFWQDKRAAVKGRRRIREKHLLRLALAGGSLGAFTAMQLLRHKTRQRRFQILVPLSGLLWLLLYALVL